MKTIPYLYFTTSQSYVLKTNVTEFEILYPTLLGLASTILLQACYKNLFCELKELKCPDMMLIGSI
jgi:hypothetical protein